MKDQHTERTEGGAAAGWIAYLRCVQALKKAQEGNAHANAR